MYAPCGYTAVMQIHVWEAQLAKARCNVMLQSGIVPMSKLWAMTVTWPWCVAEGGTWVLAELVTQCMVGAHHLCDCWC
jgi:hypothetical protein